LILLKQRRAQRVPAEKTSKNRLDELLILNWICVCGRDVGGSGDILRMRVTAYAKVLDCCPDQSNEAPKYLCGSP
jgi:hypothetical protein